MVIWVIGLAGAGKSTIGAEVYRLLRARKPNVVFLDGDHVRAIMGGDLGHTLDDRRRNADRICRLCQFLDAQEIDVVCSILSIFPESRAWNRAHLSRYFEVYLDVPMAVLERRDQKGLYSAARAGRARNVVGFDIPFEPPSTPDLILYNGDPPRLPAELAGEIVMACDRPSP